MLKEEIKIRLLKEEYRLLIDGEQVEASSKGWFDTYNPATGEVIARVAKGTREDVDRAVAAARHALEKSKWAKWPASRRGQILNRVAAIMRERFEDLVKLEVLNSGKSLSAAQGQVHQAIEDFEMYAGAVHTLSGESKPVPNGFFELHAEGACRGLRPDRSLELSADDGRLEDRPGPGRRMHHRLETGHPDPADGLCIGRDLP